MVFSFLEQDISIPFRHPFAMENEVDGGLGIRGTLVVPGEQDSSEPNKRCQNRVVVLCHGQGGHRNYIYHRVLAHRLAEDHGLYSFRFDFRNYGDSQNVDSPDGQTAQAEQADISVVMDYLVYEKELTLAAVVAHSRAVQATFTWALLQQTKSGQDGFFVPNIINCSGRHRTGMVLDFMRGVEEWHDPNHNDFPQLVRRFGKKAEVNSTRHEFVTISGYDMDLVKYLRPDTSVLTIHGDHDFIVPVDDAYIYNKLLKGRHTMKIIPGADHNYFLTTQSLKTEDENERRPNAVNQVVDLISDFLSVENENKRFFKLHKHLPTGKTRFIPLPGVENLRDFGGFPVTRKRAGRRQWVKSGLLFRASKLDLIENPQTVADLGIKQVYDLRSQVELNPEKMNSDGLFHASGVVTTHLPLFSTKAYSPQALAKRFGMYAQNAFSRTYSEILEAGAARGFRDMFLWLRDHPDEGMLFHCSAGKDRTGIFAALVLLLLGVEPDTVAHEYELTTLGYASERNRIIEAARFGFFKTRPEPQFKNITVDGWATLLSSTYTTMMDTIGMLNRKYGGVEHYLINAVGLTREDLDVIRGNLLYDGEPIKVDRIGRPNL